MLSGNSLLKKPIVTHNTGNTVGHIDDILIDPFSNRLVAFVTARQFYGEMTVVPWTGITKISPDYVMVWASTMVVRAKELFEIQHLLRQGTVTQGTQFRTTDGHSVGTMADFYVDERNGTLVGYELAGEEQANTEREHLFLPAREVIALSMHQGVAQIRPGAVSRSAGHHGCTARLEQAVHDLVVQENEGSVADPIALAQHLLPQIVGCPAQRMVTTGDGYIVVVEGQTITDTIIQYARQKQSEIELLSAVRFDLNAWLDSSTID